MNKLFAIYTCVLLIIISIVLPLLFPAVLIKAYMEQGFSGKVILIAIITIFAEPLTVGISYRILTNIKYIYNDFLM